MRVYGAIELINIVFYCGLMDALDGGRWGIHRRAQQSITMHDDFDTICLADTSTFDLFFST